MPARIPGIPGTRGDVPSSAEAGDPQGPGHGWPERGSVAVQGIPPPHAGEEGVRRTSRRGPAALKPGTEEEGRRDEPHPGQGGEGDGVPAGGEAPALAGGGEGSASDGDSDDDGGRADLLAQLERNYRPLVVWRSPHNGGEAAGLPGRMVTEVRADENGIEETVTVRRPAPLDAYSAEDQIVPKVLAKWLRPHQREGVRFMYECVMGMREFDGQGCILADDMGLGKTLQSVALIHTLLKTGISSRKGDVTCKRVIVVCPCSLVKNWDNEFVKWLGPGTVKTLALAESDRKTVEKVSGQPRNGAGSREG